MKRRLVLFIISVFFLSNLFSQEVEVVDSSIYIFPENYDSTAMQWKDTFKIDTSYLNKFDFSIPKLIISERVIQSTSIYFIYFFAVWMLIAVTFFYHSDSLLFAFSTVFNGSLINQLVREKNIISPLVVAVSVGVTLFAFIFSLNIYITQSKVIIKLTLLLFLFLAIKFLIAYITTKVSDYYKEIRIAIFYQIIIFGLVAVLCSFFLAAHYFGIFFTPEMYFTFVFTLLGVSIFFYCLILFRSYQFINTQYAVSFFLYLCTFELIPLLILIRFLVHKTV